MFSTACFELEQFYRVIAPYYDLVYDDLNAGEDVRFYRRLAEASSGPLA